MYCWDTLWSVPSSLTRAVAQGVDPPDSTCDWVPCGVFHHGGSSLSLHARVGRLALYWWRALRWLPPPWHAREKPHCDRPSPGPMDEAWAELDAQAHDPDLDWI